MEINCRTRIRKTKEPVTRERGPLHGELQFQTHKKERREVVAKCDQLRFRYLWSFYLRRTLIQVDNSRYFVDSLGRTQVSNKCHNGEYPRVRLTHQIQLQPDSFYLLWTCP